VIRTEYLEFQVENGKKKCYNCYHKGLVIARKLWEEEQRRELGPDWVGCPTRKKMAFKKPISLGSCSSSMVAGGGGLVGVKKNDIITKEAAKGICVDF
jgi:hypothetical protein